jgi:hypothetical protein
MPKIKAVKHFNKKIPISRCPKDNLAGLSIYQFLFLTPET